MPAQISSQAHNPGRRWREQPRAVARVARPRNDASEVRFALEEVDQWYGEDMVREHFIHLQEALVA